MSTLESEEPPTPGEHPRYNTIGTTYSTYRRTEPTWLAAIDAALGDAKRVLNVGAGTGNYEQQDRSVIAVEPSSLMLAQRTGEVPAVQGFAEALPFADDSFDAAMAVLTLHHWSDRITGLSEVARVAPRQVITLYERVEESGFWLLDYFPETLDTEMERKAPTVETVAEVVEVEDVQVLWVPQNCHDGFAAAGWARPHLYLEPDRQAAISVLALLDPDTRKQGTDRLRADLDSGAWHERYGRLLENEKMDFGYRLATCRRRG